MNINRKIITICFCFSIFLNVKGQSNFIPNGIDSICIHIDSISRSFEEFDFEVNYPKVSVGYRIHYIDTLDKQYKKITFKSMLDTLTKTFYFETDKLIEIKIEKNVNPKQTARYQFNEDTVFNKWDPDQLVISIQRLVSEGKRYFMLVRYKYK